MALKKEKDEDRAEEGKRHEEVRKKTETIRADALMQRRERWRQSVYVRVFLSVN